MRKPVSRAVSYRAAMLSDTAARQRLEELRRRPMLWADESAEAIALARRLGEHIEVWRRDLAAETWSRLS